MPRHSNQLKAIELQFSRARLRARVGNTVAERSKPQAIELSLAISFRRKPSACTSDMLEETVCYDNLVQVARKRCGLQTYKLIECLCFDLFCDIKRLLPRGVLLWVSITKVRPPVPELRNGVSFAIGDWKPSSLQTASS